jgi:predicted nucleic acid-binding protein
MAHLLDTDIIIVRLAGDAATIQLLAQLAPAGLAISIITYMETWQGLLRGHDPRAAQTQFEALTMAIPVLPFSPSAARRCAALREFLAGQGRRVRPRALDLITAAIALEHDLTLVTRNIDDFNDIPGLRLYQW